MAYKTKYRPSNTDKYLGDINNIVCRSLWERGICKWLDNNVDVKRWGSELVIVRYYDKVKKQERRYFVDFIVEFRGGKVLLIECKPKKQVYKPEPPKNKGISRRRFLRESRIYTTNICKWKAATAFAKEHGWEFAIWTEDMLDNLGIKYLKPLKKKKLRRNKKAK